MNAATAERHEFAPPPAGGMGRALALALLAHLLLILALTWGLRWQRDAQEDTVEAELWSPTVQRAASRSWRACPSSRAMGTPKAVLPRAKAKVAEAALLNETLAHRRAMPQDSRPECAPTSSIQIRSPAMQRQKSKSGLHLTAPSSVVV